MREGGYSLGGEQTGHTIFGDIERTGDGIMTSLRVMEVIRAERETLSQLTAPCKLLPQAQVAVHVADNVSVNLFFTSFAKQARRSRKGGFTGCANVFSPIPVTA